MVMQHANVRNNRHFNLGMHHVPDTSDLPNTVFTVRYDRALQSRLEISNQATDRAIIPDYPAPELLAQRSVAANGPAGPNKLCKWHCAESRDVWVSAADMRA